MFNIDEFFKAAVPPKDLESKWFERAAEGVDYLIGNARSEQIIICTNIGQSLVHAVLVPLSNVSPPNGDDLMRAHTWADSHWALEHVSGGGASPTECILLSLSIVPVVNLLLEGSSLYSGVISME